MSHTVLPACLLALVLLDVHNSCPSAYKHMLHPRHVQLRLLMRLRIFRGICCGLRSLHCVVASSFDTVLHLPAPLCRLCLADPPSALRRHSVVFTLSSLRHRLFRRLCPRHCVNSFSCYCASAITTAFATSEKCNIKNRQNFVEIFVLDYFYLEVRFLAFSKMEISAEI